MRTNSNIIKKGMPPYSVNSVNLLTKIGEFGHQNRRIWSAKSANLLSGCSPYLPGMSVFVAHDAGEWSPVSWLSLFLMSYCHTDIAIDFCYKDGTSKTSFQKVLSA